MAGFTFDASVTGLCWKSSTPFAAHTQGAVNAPTVLLLLFGPDIKLPCWGCSSWAAGAAPLRSCIHPACTTACTGQICAVVVCNVGCSYSVRVFMVISAKSSGMLWISKGM
jgi:hypothetical protein